MKSAIRTGLIFNIIGVAITSVVALIAPGYFEDPNSVPVHFGADGTPDRFETAAEAARYLWILPGALVFSSALMSLVPKIEPLKANLEQSRRAYVAIWIAVTILMVFLQFGIALGMTGRDGGDGTMLRLIIASVGLIFLVLGNYMPKTRQNFFVGIRTPWTLTSSETWAKTHKLGGKLLMLTGALGLLSAFSLNGLALGLVLPAMAIGTTIILFVYSFLVWRRADDKTSAPEYLI